MKRVLIFASLLFAMGAASHAAAGSGDLDGDGKRTTTDLNLLRDYLLGKVTLTAAQQTQADVNGDSQVHIADIIKMLNQKPVIGTFGIDNGAAATSDRNVTLNNTCSFGPYEYMASETSGFNGASWLPYTASPVFTLSAGNGTKTVWFKVRNVAGISVAQSDTITLNEQTGGQTVTLNLPGGVPLVLVKCPAGSFQMGSPDTERSRSPNEGPVHTVNISKAFYMGKYEVTQKQWVAVMGSWPGPAPSSTYGVGDSYPAYYVSWNDIAGANGFIDRLNAHLASTGQGGGARLPSEAEWEYAYRAGTTTRFYFGDSLTQSSDADVDGPTDSAAYPGKRSDYMWWRFNCQGNANGAYGSKPVGTKLQNAFGLFDMSGNVWEWCQDWYGSYSSGSVTDPTGPVSGSYRVLRGGGWSYNASLCRSAYRSPSNPDLRYRSVGFRLVRTN